MDSAQRQTRYPLVTAADYDQFCVTAPSDARLPGGGGYPICGLSNIKADKFLDINRQQLVEASSKYGEDKRRNHFGVGINARLARGSNRRRFRRWRAMSKDQCSS